MPAIAFATAAAPLRRPLRLRALAVLLALDLALPAQAITALADAPLFASVGVPGNLALPLSVEFPTAVSVAHQDNTYASSSEYLGYFDPNKCYLYQSYATETATQVSHFYPAGAASSHTCVAKWSGNFLNWATMQTIDPFRWALTGGYRLVDTASLTILEKAWASGQGGLGNFPLRNVTDQASIVGATPYRGTQPFQSQIAGQGQMLYIGSDPGGDGTSGLQGNYYNNVNLSGTPVLTRKEPVNFDWGTGSPDPAVNADNFSARWTSSQTVPTTGTYSFRTVSDDGVRLYVNGAAAILNWTDHAPTTDTSLDIPLVAGTTLNLTLEYYERGGGAAIKLLWKAPGDSDYSVYDPGFTRRYAVRVKVCDPSAAAGGLESNCTAYANGNYKPEGLMQRYANRIRYSVFGYLNDANLYRDGGVLRARQKFVGPTYPQPGLPDAVNAEQEWDATTGVYAVNPNKPDADATATVFGTPISNSGVLNYLNKFGELTHGGYKTYDPVSELYYAALRYYKNLGNVSAWSDMTGADAGTRAAWADGFPVITDWLKKPDGSSGDPIQYTCQKNFILGIGDVNTHADKNLPGPTGTTNEPTKPGPSDGLMGDTTFSSAINALTLTNQVGVMQGMGSSLGTAENIGGCCNNNSALMAGLAFDANTRDIRPDLADMPGTIGQTVQTFWVDVLEGQQFKTNNQFYLAAKYGGFAVPSGFDRTSTAALPLNTWNTTTDTVGGQPRPDNYYTAGRPDQMVDGLTKAFASIASQLRAYTTSLATALPQVSTINNASFSAQYEAQNWSGDIVASTLSFDATTSATSAVENWRFASNLETQAASDSGRGWDTKRNIVTWNPAPSSGAARGVAFRSGNLSTAQLAALDTTYVSGNDSVNYLNYLRGDRSNEKGTTSATAGNPYRLRSKLLGDIVGSKAQPVGPPNFPYSEAANVGYSAFKSGQASRQLVVYAGANDGMLHAVNGSLTGTGAGTELFAYVPAALFSGPTSGSVDGLAALGKPAFTHHNYVNATPTVYDIDFAKTWNGSAIGSGTADWRSVLIGGLGKGGKSYYAIDVTNPSSMTSEAAVAGKVLWEFTDPDLGFSYGEPVVAKTKKYGWVVIFGSGYNSGSAGAFFIVNPRTGALLEKRSTSPARTTDTTVSDGLAYVTALVQDGTDGTADAAYAGDLLGNVWRLDLTGTGSRYPDPLQMAVLTDSSGAVQPVTSRPLVGVQPKTFQRFVMVGTGRLLDGTDTGSTQGQSYYALLDGTGTRFNAAADLPPGIGFPLRRANLVADTDLLTGVVLGGGSMGWYLDLGAGSGGIGWRVVSASAIFLNSVAFAAALPNGQACTPSGSSRIYSVEFGTGKTVLTSSTRNISTGATTTTDIPYNDTVSGFVIGVQYVSINGKLQLTASSDAGGLQAIDSRAGRSAVVRRLNWRELPLVN